MPKNNSQLGITLMIFTTFVFAAQDGVSRHLAGEYNVYMVVMVRYWFFAAFVISYAKMKRGSVREAARTTQPFLQIMRGLILVAEICIMVLGFVYLGLIEAHAIFTAYPLIVAGLSGVILGETVGWQRWSAIFIGFIGVLIILQPGFKVFSPNALFPLIAALMFALYGLLTRYAARKDTAETSFFWTGVVGAIAMTCVGVFHWEPMTATDWMWMAVLCVIGALGHFTLIKCYEVSEAITVQPFAYMQLVFGSVFGIFIFSERLELNTAIGAGIVIAAGLFTLWRERQNSS